jgi:anti-anti-sigma factor
MKAATYTLHIVTDDAPVVIAVTGELDVTNVSDFVASVTDVPAPRPVVLDLSDLSYLDSAGLATLDRLTGTNSAVVVIPRTSPLFRAADLMDLPRHDTREQAVKAAK